MVMIVGSIEVNKLSNCNCTQDCEIIPSRLKCSWERVWGPLKRSFVIVIKASTRVNKSMETKHAFSLIIAGGKDLVVYWEEKPIVQVKFDKIDFKLSKRIIQ